MQETPSLIPRLSPAHLFLFFVLTKIKMEVRGEPGNYVGDLSFMFLVLYLDGSLNQLTQQTLSVVLAVEQWNMMAGWPSSECLCNIYIYIYVHAVHQIVYKCKCKLQMLANVEP